MLSSLFPAVSSRLIICIKSYARKLTPLERSLVVVGPVVYSLVSFFGPSPARSKNQDYARNLAGAQRNVHGEDSACPTTGISPLCLLPCPFHPFSSLSPSSVPRVPAPRLGSDPQKTTARPHPALPSLRARAHDAASRQCARPPPPQASSSRPCPSTPWPHAAESAFGREYIRGRDPFPPAGVVGWCLV